MKKTAVVVVALAGLWAVPAAQERPGRVRPPEGVTCPPNNLTVYTGRVTAMSHLSDATSITIATDWNTTERVVIRHPDSRDPDAAFLIAGKPFVRADWDVIAPKGKLRDGARASAWLCKDGRNPIVDWEKPRSGLVF
jgi:hypothetical protein